MSEKQQALDFIMGLEAAGCVVGLTGAIALAAFRGIGPRAVLEAMSVIRAERREANSTGPSC